jgi:hypothetical protein
MNNKKIGVGPENILLGFTNLRDKLRVLAEKGKKLPIALNSISKARKMT